MPKMILNLSDKSNKIAETYQFINNLETKAIAVNQLIELSEKAVADSLLKQAKNAKKVR